MELVLNFEKKEFAVNEECNYLDLHKRLKKLLRDDLKNWVIAGHEAKWLYQYYTTITYQEPARLAYATADSPYKITYGNTNITDSIVCFSDNPENEETEV